MGGHGARPLSILPVEIVRLEQMGRSFMAAKNGKSSKGLGRELRQIVQRAYQVWRLISRRHKVALGIAAFLMALTSACNTALPVLLGDLVNSVRRGLDEGAGASDYYGPAAFFLGLIGCAYLVRETLQLGRSYLVQNTCTRIERDMNVKVVAHLLKVDLAHLTHEKVGALHGRILRSIDGFVRFIRLGFLTFFPALLTGLFALGTTVAKQPKLGLIMAGVIPASIGLTLWQLVSQKGIRLHLLRSREDMDGTIVEQLSGIDFVRAANTHKHEVERVARTAERRRAKEIRHHVQMSLFGAAKALNEGLFHIFMLIYAIHLAVIGHISIGDILTFSILFLNVMTPLSEIHRVIDEGHESSLQVADLLKMLAEPLDRSFAIKEHRALELKPGTDVVVIEDMRVEYETAEGTRKRALDGVGLTIRHGEIIGIAGRSGCGKSTWLKVVLRLIHPTNGRGQLGGLPLEAVSREAIGSSIGYVGQSPFSFAGTIAENISYGSPKAPQAEIVEAARKAHIHDEIMAMPGAYQAAVAERGQNLSGGQRQRLALARLFLRNPPILILDEATSALDNISERHVQRELVASRLDRTTILVAHRLSTLRDADRILVFNDGRIVETGTYTDLIARDGLFAELVRSAEEGSMAREKARLELAAQAPEAVPA